MDNLLLANIFSGQAFDVLTLTSSINIVPTQYGRVNAMGLFTPKPVSTSVAMLEFNNQVLNLIPSTPRGQSAPKSKPGKRAAKALSIPRIALDDMIFPSDIAGVRAFGSNNLQTAESVTNDKLVALAKKHDITNEYLKCGALAGIVTDADGSTLLNLFTEFNVSEQTVSFDFTDADEDIIGIVNSIIGMIEDELKGDVMSHVGALCSPTFWAKFISHPRVAASFANYQNMVNTVAGYAAATDNPLRNDVRKGFNFGGIVWEEYRGKGTYLNGDNTTTTRNFVEAGKARFFPVGTTETFIEWQAPAEWMETINTPGLPRYAKVVPEAGGRHVEVLSESSPLPICTRPKVLVKGNATLA